MHTNTKLENIIQAIQEFISSFFWKGFLLVNGYTEERYNKAKWIDEVLYKLNTNDFNHSVYLHCRSCNIWGTPNPISLGECGNCGNTTDVTTYIPVDFF